MTIIDSNTFKFYKKTEEYWLNQLIQNIQNKTKHDISLNIGVGNKKFIKFYEFEISPFQLLISKQQIYEKMDIKLKLKQIKI